MSYPDHPWKKGKSGDSYFLGLGPGRRSVRVWRLYPDCWMISVVDQDGFAVRAGGSFGTAEQAAAWAEAHLISPLELVAVSAKDNPTRHVFTPSYEADSLEEYDRKVQEGQKRNLHVMVERGRTGARYGEAAAEQTPKTRAERRSRWADRLPPWGARTQSLAAHEVSHLPPSMRGKTFGPAAAGPELEVARSIRRYRETQPGGDRGFLVPDSVWPLLDAGMPRKEARILVQRAARTFYPEVPRDAMAELVSPKRSLLAAVSAELRAMPFVRASEISIPGSERRGLGRLVEVSAAAPSGQSEVLATDEDIERAINEYKESIERTRRYSFREDGPRFIETFFAGLQQRLEALSAAWNAPSLVLELWFAGLNEPFEVDFSSAEHSKFGEGPGSSFRVKYKSLQNVSLSDLPRLLVRLARRKKRRGRRLQPIVSRKNPSMTQPMQQLEAFVLSEQEAGRLVPVPGKPGRVYWFSQRKKQLTETTDSRAKSWLAIAQAGRASRGALSHAASRAYIEEGLDRGKALPASAPRQITTSHPIRENPMSYEDDFWFEQYREGPYGARRSVPAARRNAGRRKKKKRKGSPQAKQAMLLAQQIAKASGCDMSAALSEAWAEVKGHRAAANPWYPGTPSLYLPDTTQTVSALVPGPYSNYQDRTQRRSALVPGPYGRHNPGVQIAKNGQPYVTLPNGKTRFISKDEAAAMGVPASAMRNPSKTKRRNPSKTKRRRTKAKRKVSKASKRATKHHKSGKKHWKKGPINYRRGQFSVTETGGFQPVNRRNPSHKQKAKMAMDLFHSGQAPSLKAAWAIVKRHHG